MIPMQLPPTPDAAVRSSARWLCCRARRILVPVALTILAGTQSSLLAAQPASMPQVDVVQPSQSVFVDDPKFGKDPFYPRSKRRGIELVAISTPIGTMPDLVLKGISGSKDRRLALINNRTLEKGEETEIKFNNQSVKVRLVDIREKSVVVSVDGQSKEIFLRQNL
jgi:hypothetical protein